LVKPSFSIPADATGIHGITDDMVKDAPSFADIRDRLIEFFRGKPLVMYNADYDKQILLNAHVGLDGLFAPAAASAHHCAMEQYAQFYGEWNDYHGNYRWQSLGSACHQQGIQFIGTAHSALGDCRATLAVIKKMAEFEAEKSAATESPS
jgi:DNA polymerase III epsilon subunit-like protein